MQLNCAMYKESYHPHFDIEVMNWHHKATHTYHIVPGLSTINGANDVIQLSQLPNILGASNQCEEITLNIGDFTNHGVNYMHNGGGYIWAKSALVIALRKVNMTVR